MKDSEWVLLRSFTERAQAELLGEFLEHERIECSVEGASSAGVLPGICEVRVMVRAENLAAAQDASEAYDGTRGDNTTVH